ncbi:hypothetical protein EV646_102178 [Kribbella antiqua]|uniref:DUF222 domain-containing protein n=1 Tax=Kribbella antiqua TaxID=2512217 RepID=A0A4R2J461_9ACTN|nr:hypothetical protein [Kribbella antiqua]TCO50105.1 hypothetical protein EV646_102178 [Kribbella antiqua]
MFEGDLTSLSTADLLESAADHRAAANRVDARLLEHAQLYADRFHPDKCPTRPGRTSSGGRERAIVLGGDGCPEIAEFAPAEFGVVVGVSTGVAARLIGEALALRHRFPFIWAKVRSGEATPWKARQIAAACLKLSEDAARYVDQRVAGIVDTITPYRLDKIITAARFHADAAAARAEAEQKARERGVFVARGSDHGTTTIYIRTSTGNAKRYDATIDGIAEALKVFGDTRSLNARRAEAVGIIADPRYTEQLLLQAQAHHAQSTAQPDDASAEDGDAHAEDDTEATLDAGDNADAPTDTEDDADAPTDTEDDASACIGTGTDVDDGAMPQPATATAPSADASRPGSPTTNPAEHATMLDDTPCAGASNPVPPATNPGDSDATPGGFGVAPIIAPSNYLGGRLRPAADAATADEERLDGWETHWCEPGPDEEADRDAPHPSQTDLPDPLDTPSPIPEPWDNPDGSHADDDAGEPMDSAAWRALQARLAQIKHDAHATPRAAHANSDRPGATGTMHGTPMPPDRTRLPSGGAVVPSGGTPRLSDGTSRHADGTPAASGGTPVPSDGTRTLSDGRLIPADGTPKRSGLSDGTPMPTDGTSMPSRGTPMSADGTAMSSGTRGTGGRAGGGRLRPGKTEIYVHLTDHTLATGTGVLRVEELGPHLAAQLTELIGHGPYVVKPVIDLNHPIAVDAYEIPDRIRERVKLIHPAEQFPYGTTETTTTTDLDHIQPYNPQGPTEQTSTTNLAPITRFHHRLKTHGRWKVRRLDPTTLEWTTPHGFVFHVDPTGTHRVPAPDST